MNFPIEHSLSSMDPQLGQLTPRLKLRSVYGPCLLRMTRIFTMWTVISGLSKPRGGDAPTLTELQGVQVNEFLAVPASRDTGVPMGS